MHSYVFINSGGSAIKFINADFTILYYFSLQELKNYLRLNIINNYSIISGAFIYYLKLFIRISHYTKKYIFLLIKLGHYLVVLDIK